jgi:hypothetical protein
MLDQGCPVTIALVTVLSLQLLLLPLQFPATDMGAACVIQQVLLQMH